ncbi:MAG: DUF2863 family protein [Burkholderiaceae bacterium]
MKESRQPRGGRDRKGHLSADAERLVTAALGIANSGSRVEDRYWDALLGERLARLLANGHAQPVYDALERLNQTDPDSYGALIEAVEEHSESVTVEGDDGPWQILLISAPLVAWTRFAIPTGAIARALRDSLVDSLRSLVLAQGARLYLMPSLLSIDQLPRDYADLRRLTARLGEACLRETPPNGQRDLPEAADMLADARFLVGAVAVRPGDPVFRWQNADLREQGGRVQALEKWVEHARPIAEQLLPGCGFECLLPDAYHINMRESDRRVRPYGIRASVHFLTHALDVEPAEIRAVVAGFGFERVDEYRIGLSVDRDGEDVAHGVVWPLLGAESEQDDPPPLTRIRQCLREAGITEISVWPNVTEPEYCEDCGAPMYPNDKGEVVHAELPGDVSADQGHFH